MKILINVILASIILANPISAISLQEKKDILEKYIPSVVMHGEDIQKPESIDIYKNCGNYIVEVWDWNRIHGVCISEQSSMSTEFLPPGCGWGGHYGFMGGYMVCSESRTVIQQQLIAALEGNYDQVNSDITGSVLPIYNSGCQEMPSGGRTFQEYDWPGDEPYEWKSAYQNCEKNDKPTVYGTVFEKGNKIIAQYFYHYAFNDWVNKHEGDWENVNIILNGTTKKIEKLQYFFHHKYFEIDISETENYDIVNDHIILYIGGQESWGGNEGNASHGIYPFPATFSNVGIEKNLLGIPLHSTLEETVDGEGTVFFWHQFNLEFAFEEEKEQVSPFFNSIRWGYFNGTIAERLSDVPTISPPFGSRWHKMGDETEADLHELSHNGRTSYSAYYRLAVPVVTAIITPLLLN